MDRVVSPTKAEFDKLRQPLERGEQLVFYFFDRCLAPEWEIYIQPHMNGLRPDFVLLNPQVGMAIFEVKDWDLDAIYYHVKQREEKPPALFGSRNGKTFSQQSDRLLVIYIGNAVIKIDLALIHTRLTRLKRSIKGSCFTVVSSAAKLRNFEEKWPDFAQKIELALSFNANVQEVEYAG